MELPSLSGFKRLLEEDEIFVDYLNAFLNLPVFAKRIIYNSKKKQSYIEPELNFTHHVPHESKLISWIHESRLPLFWASDLFYEYRLCCAIVKDNGVIPVEKTHWIASVSAMHGLRKFLFRTEGESAWMFSVDVEKLKSTKESFLTQKLVARIQHLYLEEGAPFLLKEDIKERMLFFYDGENEAKRRLSLSQRKEIFVHGQSLALEELKSYWCNRYILHLQSNETTNSNIVNDQDFLTILNISEGDRKIRNHKQSFFLPRIIEDEGNSGANMKPKRASHVQFNTEQLHVPPLSSGTSLCTSARLIPSKLSTQLNPLHLLITPSTEALFSRTSRAEAQQHESGSITQKDVHLLPYLTASLRADFMAGNPLLRYLKKVERNRKAVDYLLFWQSVENILTQDEMRRWYLRKFEARDCPYLSYYESYPVARNLKELLRLYIKNNAPHKIGLSEETRKELMVLLPKGLGQSLVLTLQEMATQHLLKPWQDYLLYDHLQFMKKCTSHKILTRLASSITTEATADTSPTPQFVTGRLFSSSHLHCMWSALRFAEAAKFPGIYQLPSRRLTDVSLHDHSSKNRDIDDGGDSDSQSHADDEEMVEEFTESMATTTMTTLSPMVTTVYDKMNWDFEKKRGRQEILYITKPIHSSDFYSRKPKVPQSFLDVLKDREHLEYFRHYLLMHGVNAETPLQFWIAVEDIKSTMNNKRAINHKMKRIRERFVCGESSRSPSSFDSIFFELGNTERLNLFQLLAAQAATVSLMEKKWFANYAAHLKSKDEEENKSEEEMIRPRCTESTKGLWGMFAHNVISFRRGLMNSATADMFKRFLQDEVLKGNRGPARQKKLIGTKVVNVTKLLSDLSFWAEVERYKDLADLVRLGKEKGTHTPEDDILVHKKAHAIVNCFIDSAVSPKVQINISPELVGIILDNISQGQITRGLFHEAALNIFSVLILYWKKFCVARFAPRNRRQSAMSGVSYVSPHDLDGVSEMNRDGRDWHGFFGDGGPILSYSLSYGLRWSYYPGHPHPHHPIAYQYGAHMTTVLLS